MNRSDATPDALLPCPFCGNTDIDREFSYHQRPAEEGGEKFGHEPGCMECGATAPFDIWNTRAVRSERPEPKLVAALNEVVSLLEMTEEASTPGTDTWGAIKRASEVLADVHDAEAPVSAIAPISGAYEPLSKERIEELRGVVLADRENWPSKAYGKEINTLCAMAENCLLYAGEIHRLRDVPSSSALTEELRVTDALLEERNRVLRAIPGCEVHGDQCVPHALEWIEKAKAPLSATATKELEELREFVRDAFKAHPNLDLDIEQRRNYSDIEGGER